MASRARVGDSIEHLCSHFCPGGNKKAHKTLEAHEIWKALEATKLSPKVIEAVNSWWESKTIRIAVCKSYRELQGCSFHESC